MFIMHFVTAHHYNCFLDSGRKPGKNPTYTLVNSAYIFVLFLFRSEINAWPRFQLEIPSWIAIYSYSYIWEVTNTNIFSTALPLPHNNCFTFHLFRVTDCPIVSPKCSQRIQNLICCDLIYVRAILTSSR